MLYVIHRDGKPWHGANKRTNNVRAYESEGKARQVMNGAITGECGPKPWKDPEGDAIREFEAARWQIVEYAPITKEESA